MYTRLLLQIYRFLLAAYWANDETVRKALQIKKVTIYFNFLGKGTMFLGKRTMSFL